MPYTAITNRRSVQWDLQQRAVTNQQGLRTYNGYYMVAVGTYWFDYVGQMLRITLSEGKVFYAIVGDVKDDRHTDANNQFTLENGCWVEFIICGNWRSHNSNFCRTAARRGDVSHLGFWGYVVTIERVGNKEEDSNGNLS